MSYGLAVSYRANQPFIFGAKQKADLSDSFFHNELRKYKLETKTPKEKKRICFWKLLAHRKDKWSSVLSSGWLVDQQIIWQDAFSVQICVSKFQWKGQYKPGDYDRLSTANRESMLSVTEHWEPQAGKSCTP